MCRLHAIWCPAPYKMCCLDLTISWAVYLSMLMPCIYLACHHRKRFIVLFRLAHWLLALKRTAPYSRLLFGCRFCLIRAKQLPGPLAIGSRDSPSLGYKQAPRPVQDLLAGKGAHLEFSLSRKVTTLGPLEQPTSHDADLAEPEASRSSVSSN